MDSYRLLILGMRTAAIALIIATACVILPSGCVTELKDLADPRQAKEDAAHALEPSQPEIGDGGELKAAKEELARSRRKWTEEKEALTATITSIRAKTNAEIGRLQEELAQQKRLNEEAIRQVQSDFHNMQFPFRYVYLISLAIIVIGAVAAYLRKNPVLVMGGVLLAAILLGIAYIQKVHPEWFMYCAFASAAPVAIYGLMYFISWLRKEKAIKIMAQAIESDAHTKAVIKEDSSVAGFIETQIRKYIPDGKTQQA